MALCSSPNLIASLRYQTESFRTNSSYIVFSATGYCASSKLFASAFLSLHRRNSSNRFAVASAASRQKKKHFEAEVGKVNEVVESEVEEPQEAWKEVLASVKEQALKMQSLSQEAYGLNSNKAIVILKETSEHLKIQADKTRRDLIVMMKEVNEESQEYLSSAAKQSHEPVKVIVETLASSNDELKDISKTKDFCLGVPYGAILSLGGFLSFMITGSISAIRFGVILGGTLLALSISSMKSQKRGESFSLALKGQTVISSIIFLREVRLLTQGASIGGFFATLISGAMVAFYVYRITSNCIPKKGLNLEHGTET